MRIIFAIALLLVVATVSRQAHADWVMEGSVGEGGRVSAPRGWEPTNVMVAPGYALLGMLRLQLGLVGELADVKNSKFDLQLRPMVGFYPPIIPLYVRAIFAVESLLHTSHVGVGGALGVKIGLPFIGLGLFAEAGLVSRFVDSKTQSVLEGRVGAFWVF